MRCSRSPPYSASVSRSTSSRYRGTERGVVAPDVRRDELAGEVDLDRDRFTSKPERLRIECVVVLGLPALFVESLLEVPAAVEEPHADQGHAEVGRGLEVVAGEDAQAAGVDRQPRLEAELHAEVGDQDIAVVAVRLRPPRGAVGRRARRHRTPEKLAEGSVG